MDTTRSFSRALLVSSAAVIGALALGCASSSGEATSNGEGNGSSSGHVGETDESLDALVAYTCSEGTPRRFDAALLSGSCTTVRAETGTWIARPLFADAPDDVKDSYCRFTWRGKVAGNAPERAALESAVHGSLTPTCARGAPPIVDPTRDEEVNITPQGGSIGCDVCGKNRDRNGWVIIPPDQRWRDRVRVRVALEATSPSRTQPNDVRLEVPVPQGASALTVRLPAPPSGFVYRDDTLVVGGM